MLATSSPAPGEIAPLARRRAFAQPEPLAVATVVAIAAGVAIRAVYGADQPLWFDETFTGAIAAEPTLAATTRQILLDVNSPLYYLIAHVWSLAFGLSNASLRFPAFVFSSLAPLLCLIATPSLPRRTRLVWAILVALWAPGFAFAQEARCYSLVFCLAVALASAFAALLDAPDRRRATLWAVLGCLAVLAHYYALVLVGIQGLTFLAIHRRRALACWPAALVFVPLFGWLAIHYDSIVAFTAAGVAWYNYLHPADLLDIAAFVTGSTLVMVPLLLGGGAAVLVHVAARLRERADLSGQRAAMLAASTSVAAAAFWIVLGFVRASFTLRYMMVFEPGILLGVALAAEALRRRWRTASALVIALFATNALLFAAVGRAPKIYGFQRASDALMAAGTRRLVIFWDNPNSAVEAPSQLAIVGGFFFARRGLEVHVEGLVNPRGADPNPRLLASAMGPDAGILWLYDTRIHDTAAAVFPPTIARTPGWACRDFGVAPVGVLACARRNLAG